MKIKTSKFLAVLCILAMMVIAIVPMFTLTATAAEKNVEISFATTAQRVSQTTSQQVWKNGDVTFTNDKGSSTSNVADYSNPVRLYQNSKITIAAPGNITKIVVTANSSSYATALKNSVGTEASASGSTVTITPTASSTTYTIAKLTAQIRLNKLTVYYEEGASTEPDVPECEHANSYEMTVDPTHTSDGYSVEYCPDCEKEIGDRHYTVPALGYNVSFVVPEGMEAPTANAAVKDGKVNVTMPNVADLQGNYAKEYEFAGWALASVDAETNVRPTLYPAGTSVEISANTTFYAVYSYEVSTGESATESGWLLRDTVSAGDIVVITMTKSGTIYAINSSNGSSKAPAANTIVTVADGKITSTVDNTIKWTVSGTDGAWTFHPNGDTSKWLYTTNDNNGVRVGTNTNNKFTVSGNYLQNTSTNRYIGVYNTQDWRCYTTNTGSSNIANQTLGIYVWTEGGIETYYTSVLLATECDHANAETVTVNATCTENGSITTTCSCGYTTVETIEAFGHDWDEGELVTAPDCTTPGEMIHYCNNGCDETKTTSVDALGHSYVGGKCEECGEKVPFNTQYTISEFSAGVQYAENEVHKLDSILTMVTTQCHFTTDLRIYSSSSHNGNVVLESAAPIYGLSFNAGENADELNIYGLVGEEWVIIETVEVTSAYKVHTVYFDGESYTKIKLDVEGANQIRIKNFTVQYMPAKISGVSVSLGKDLSLLYQIEIADGTSFDDFRMVFAFNDDTRELVGAENGKYTLAGIAPHQMGDTVTATLYYGDEVVDVYTTSIKAYLDAIIAGDYSEEAKQLANDLLIYGAAAQKHTGHNTDALVTDKLPEVDDNDRPIDKVAATQVADQIENLSFTQVGVHFNYVNKLYVIVDNTAGENITVKINGKVAEIGEDGHVYTGAVAPTQFGDAYTFALYVDGELYQTVEYSVNAYINTKWNADSGLAKALYNYAESFTAYSASLDNQ